MDIILICYCHSQVLEVCHNSEKFMNITYVTTKTCDTSVSMVTGYGLDDQGSRIQFLMRAGNFSLHHHVQNGSGAHPTCYPVDTGGSFPGIKRPGREADHSLLSSAESRMCGAISPLSSICLHGMMLS